MKKRLFIFLNQYLNANRPLLLGLSGGPDSLALLYLLKEYPLLKLGIAHIDHGWRTESHEEAHQLEMLAKQLNIPFHLKKINCEAMKGNLEEACRNIRLQFFKELCREFDYQAVVLGHQKDDLIETILKRVLEGAALTHLVGINKEAVIDGLTIWRPFLDISKAEILNWLNNQQLSFFVDQTNEDSRFLRGRFRTKIFPWLTTEFGKEIKPALCRIGEEAGELKDYLNHRIQPYINKIINHKIGAFLDLAQENIESFELKYLVRCFCEKYGFHLSHDSMQKVCHLFFANMANKKFSIGNKTLYIDRKRFFIFHFDFEWVHLKEKQSFFLQEGIFQYGLWQVKISSEPYFKYQEDWKSIWKEEVSIWLPKKEYYFAPAKLTTLYRQSSISEWWTNHKIPAFLRSVFPVVWENEHIVHELLSGKIQDSKIDQEGFKVTFMTRI